MHPQKNLLATFLLVLFVSGLGPLLAAPELPSPEQFLKHRVGEDRYLAPYPKVLEYLGALAGQSRRVSMETAGRSTLGNEMAVVVLTSAENQKHLARYRRIARQLASPGDLTPQQAAALVQEGKVIVLVTCSIHSTEVGSTQMVMELVHQLASSTDSDVSAWLDDVILLIMPSINPDGQVMVVDWYNRQKGTKFEGGPMPWLYHHYVGHDNNRDFYMLTQKETQAVNDVLYHRWFPQVYLDEHQMGSVGPRMFVPPQTDPLAPEVDSLIFRQADLLGTAMGMRLEEAGKTGVGNNMIYDSYWPGGTRNTAWWKNVTGLLTEVASARIATPIRVEPGELRGGYKGLPQPLTRRANFPSVWPGGWWRLRDIIDYELIATRSLLESASLYHDSLLTNFYRMAASQIKQGTSQAPFAFLLPEDQHDPVAAGRLVELLIRHGIEVRRSGRPFMVDGRSYPEGTTFIPASQPYRAFLLTMLRRQRYPEVTPYVDGPIIPPYDITSWSLPLAMGVTIREAATPLPVTGRKIEKPAWPPPPAGHGQGGYLISHAADSVFTAMNRLLARGKPVYWLISPEAGTPPGEIYLPPEALSRTALDRMAAELHLPVRPLSEAPHGRAFKVHRLRTGLFKPWRASMDEGWTRWLLEQYEFPFVNLTNSDISTGKGLGNVDVILLPDLPASLIESGSRETTGSPRHTAPLPPPYDGGIGETGKQHLKDWVLKAGGTLVALDSSTSFVIDLLDLPVRNVLDQIKPDQFLSPGSMLRLLVDPTEPLAYGMNHEEAGYFAGSPAFATRIPDGRFSRRVVAWYPKDRRDILLSGYLLGANLLERRAAVVEFQAGAGRVILIGFRAQHRAQPVRTFKLLFNALYRSGLEKATL